MFMEIYYIKEYVGTIGTQGRSEILSYHKIFYMNIIMIILSQYGHMGTLSYHCYNLKFK